MSILRAFSSGFRRAIVEPKMVLVLYVVNLLMAIPLAMAFRSVLESGLGDSLAPAQLMGGLDFTVWQDFMTIHGDELSAVFNQITWVIVVSLFVHTFLAGGILSRVRESNGKFSASAFFGGCGKYFLRFLRLFIICCVVLLVVTLIVGTLVGVVSHALTKHATSEVTDLWIRICGAVVFLIPLMLILMAADYARIQVVVRDDRSMLRTAWQSMRFVLSRFYRTFGLQVLVVLFCLILFVIYLWLDLTIGMTSAATIHVMMIIQQLYIISRAWTKVMVYASEMSLYESLQPVVLPATGNVSNEARVEPAGA
jgi:hypothetical protein